MHVIVSYDISDNKTRLRIFKRLSELGINSQRSVFECEFTADEVRLLITRIAPLLDPETDSLLVFPLCRRCATGVDILGQGVTLVETDWKVI